MSEKYFFRIFLGGEARAPLPLPLVSYAYGYDNGYNISGAPVVIKRLRCSIECEVSGREIDNEMRSVTLLLITVGHTLGYFGHKL